MAASLGSAPISSTSSAAPSTENGGADAASRPPARRRVLYGRRHGHRLRPGRRRLLEERLPRLEIRLPEGEPLDPAALFGDRRPVWLEIGFGDGAHLAAQAAAHPGIGFIGVEPFVNGVAALLARIDREGLANIRIFTDDARLLLGALPDASVARLFVLFPDPWPKRRHHKRRLVNRATVAEFARILTPGGELRLATDDAGYARWMLEALLAEPRLDWLAERAADWRERPADQPPTRYEAKALAAGRRPVHLRFRRL
ncbi:MAG TPA: tRNA (guanosine(46)-N7)-methyltransferase TrmB [Rhodospirillales bacterium]|nr:tRNA (guanosine(46)-N7)-methyltransferase TrmB [Rhodospirillales bacterium]